MGILTNIERIRKNWKVRFDAQEPDSWITVNGNHIPLDEDKNPIGGQTKAFGELESHESEGQFAKRERSINDLRGGIENNVEYQKAREEAREAKKRWDEIGEKMKAVPSMKPESEWTEDERWWVDTFGKAMAPTNPEKAKLIEEHDKAADDLHKANEKMHKLQIGDNPIPHIADLEEPPKATSDEYEGFEKANTGTSNPMDGYYLAEMSPEDYLNRCAAMFNDTAGAETNLADQVSSLSRKSIDELKEKMQAGTKMYTPWLDETGDDGQEGRHRAAAAYELGIEKIPVYYRRKQRVE